jgi:rubrerythrin
VGSLNDRIKRLEAARGAGQEADAAERRHRRIFERLYAEHADLEPPEVSPEDERSDAVYTLRQVIPYYRARGSWSRGDGAEFLREWENSELEKLSKLGREEQSE